MGIETTDSARPAAEKPRSSLLNLLGITGERNATATGTKTPEPNGKSNFAGLPEVRGSHTLDLNAPVYPGEKRNGTATDTARPVNKYEKAVAEATKDLSTEADFTAFTQTALRRDADRFPPVRNEKDGTTTYTIEQIGLTDRNLAPGDNEADHYKRRVNITVPDSATSLKDCKFEYQDRQTIDVKEFDALVDHAQKRQSDLSASSLPEGQLAGPKDMSFYTHGIRTGAEDADFTALALQLTNGHSVINVDWDSIAIPDEKYGVMQAYDINRRGAAESYPKFEKQLDQAISHIGAENTDMIAFSHGAMFDTKYLQHRQAANAPRLDEIVFSHPDVPCGIMKATGPDAKLAESDRFYSSVSRKAFVVGGLNDWAMPAAMLKDCKPAPEGTDATEHQKKQAALYTRLGNGGAISRRLVADHGGEYVTEDDVKGKNYNHFVNLNKINALMNEPPKEAAPKGAAPKTAEKNTATKIATLEALLK